MGVQLGSIEFYAGPPVLGGPDDLDAVIREFAGGQFSTFKQALADLTVAKIGPVTAEMRRLLADPAEIEDEVRALFTALAR